MPSVSSKTLIDNATPLPPAQARVQGHRLEGRHRVSVNVSVTTVDASVRRTIFFGPPPTTASPRCEPTTSTTITC